MFLNSDTLKNRTVSYSNGNEFFKDDELVIRFEDIFAYYHQETAHIINGVYEGTKLRFTLKLQNEPKPYTIEIDSNKEEKHKNIYTLSYAIASFRAKKIEDAIKNNQIVEFESLQNFTLQYSSSGLNLTYTDKKSHYLPFEIIKIQLQKNILKFEGSNKRDEQCYANVVSDSAVFLKLIEKLPIFSDETNTIKTKETKLYFIFMGIVTVFGLNGFFEVCCMKNDILEILSTLSMILLGIVIITSPFYWIADKFNQKKLKKEFKNLKGTK